jgi:hypothetical protein
VREEEGMRRFTLLADEINGFDRGKDYVRCMYRSDHAECCCVEFYHRRLTSPLMMKAAISKVYYNSIPRQMSVPRENMNDCPTR